MIYNRVTVNRLIQWSNMTSNTRIDCVKVRSIDEITKAAMVVHICNEWCSIIPLNRVLPQGLYFEESY